MAINFPDSPSVNDTHTVNGRTWVWDGSAWKLSGTINNGISLEVSDTAPSTPIEGDMWYNSANGSTYTYYQSVWVELGNTAAVEAFISDDDGDTLVHVEEGTDDDTIRFDTAGVERLTISSSGHVLPSADVSYDLGSASYRFRDLYLSGSSIDLGGVSITSDGTNLALPPISNISGDFTVDTNTLHVDSTNNRVGIGTTSPSDTLDINGTLNVRDHIDFSDTTPDAANRVAIYPHGYELYVDNVGAGTDNTRLWLDSPDEGEVVIGPRSGTASLGNMRLRSDNISLEGNTYVTSGSVGIGTASPSAKLHVKGAAANDTSPEMTIQGNGSMSFHGSLGQGSFNGIVNAGDMGIIFTDGTQGTGEFVIAPWASGTGGMRIDSSGNTAFGGYVSQPRAFFRAYRRGGQGWSLTGVQTIVFENTVFNNGNNYSTSTGRFTAPVAGYYHLGAHFFKYTTYSNSTNTYWGIFTSNGYSTTTNHGTAGQDGGQSLNCIVYMGANDYADVQITSAGSTIASYGTMNFNSFYGYLLSS